MITENQWTLFFEAFRRTGVIKSACTAAGIGRQTVYDRIAAAKAANPTPEATAWQTRYQNAEEDAGDVIEEEMHRRAVEGVEEPIIGRVGKDQDGVVVMVRKYSDALLIRLAQARRPEKFKDRQATELTGKNGGPIQTENKVIALPAIDDSALE
jgi:hypothetical protein